MILFGWDSEIRPSNNLAKYQLLQCGFCAMREVIGVWPAAVQFLNFVLR